jgi:hypothetical protein
LPETGNDLDEFAPRTQLRPARPYCPAALCRERYELSRRPA